MPQLHPGEFDQLLLAQNAAPPSIAVGAGVFLAAAAVAAAVHGYGSFPTTPTTTLIRRVAIVAVLVIVLFDIEIL